jgi:putative flippase GtrA
MLFCTEVLGIFYPISIVIGGVLGAVINFTINRRWTFRAADGKLNIQLNTSFEIVNL